MFITPLDQVCQITLETSIQHANVFRTEESGVGNMAESLVKSSSECGALRAHRGVTATMPLPVTLYGLQHLLVSARKVISYRHLFLGLYFWPLSHQDL